MEEAHGQLVKLRVVGQRQDLQSGIVRQGPVEEEINLVENGASDTDPNLFYCGRTARLGEPRPISFHPQADLLSAHWVQIQGETMKRGSGRGNPGREQWSSFS